MSVPYVSKRRKLQDKRYPETSDMCSTSLLSWPIESLNSWKLLSTENSTDLICKTETKCSRLAWSRDGTRLCVGGSSLHILNKHVSDKIDVIKVCDTIESFVAGLMWSYDSDTIITASLDGSISRLDITNGEKKNVKISDDFIHAADSWNSSVVLGGKEVFVVNSDDVLIRKFGFKEHSISDVVCVGSTVFVSYFYSQISSPDKSLVAYDLQTGAPLSNQLTSEVYSYSSLKYSAQDNKVYGITMNGILTRFSASEPFKVDKGFKMKFSVCEGYRCPFDVMKSYVVVGCCKNELVVQKLSSVTRATLQTGGSDYVLSDVRFHPTRNMLAYCKSDGTVGVINLRRHKIHIQ